MIYSITMMSEVWIAERYPLNFKIQISSPLSPTLGEGPARSLQRSFHFLKDFGSNEVKLQSKKWTMDMV